MIWHAVRFDLGALDGATRDELEAELAALRDLDVVEFLRVGRDVEQPGVTGLLVGLADHAALAAYREHPDHQPVVRRMRDLGVPITRFDLASDDDPARFA
jgi:hypothetical protein